MEDIIDDIQDKENNLIEPTEEKAKSLSEMSVDDIQFRLDTSKSYEEQAEDLVGAMATAKAVSDEETAKDIADKKAEELKAKADEKLKKAQTNQTNAQVDKQEAERLKNEAVLSTFGITKHLPDWLLKTMVIMFSPIYIVLTILIGIPCGIVKVLIDNIDNILVRYETAKAQGKPKIKVTIWIILVLVVLGVIALTVLKALGKI